jgi:hypothetical protein
VNTRLLVALLLLLGCNCISTNHAGRPGGGDAMITLADKSHLHAELLSVTPNDLYYLSAQRVWRCPLDELRSVRVEGYDMTAGKIVTLALFGAADVGVTVLWASAGCWQLAVPAIPLLLIGTAVALSSELPVKHRYPLTEGSRTQLALYCRYPQGLTDVQWQELLSFHRQDKFLSPGAGPKP